MVLPQEEDEGTIDQGKDQEPPLNTSTIHWQPPSEGIVLLELFGGIATGLAAVLQARIKVRRYLYVDNDNLAKRVAIRHIARLRAQFPTLLPRSATKRAFIVLPSDISLISREEITRHGPIDLVIAGWPCQGMSMAGHQNGLHDARSARFWDMIRVLRHIQTAQVRSLGYIVENVPVASSSRARTLESVHRIHSILGTHVLLDAAAVGSRAHRPRLW
jgi:site-specific DNA-cytosine methylase